MTKIVIAAMAALMATAVSAQVADTPPANPANQPVADGAAPPPAAGEAQVLQDLTAAGYSEPQGLVKEGDGWKGTALKDGKRVPVKVGPDGKVASPQ